jgi:hypothetical protein
VARTIVISKSTFRIESDRVAIVRKDAFIVALGPVSDATIVVGKGKFWIEPDRLAIVRKGAFIVDLCLVSDASIVVADGPVLSSDLAVLDKVRASGNGFLPDCLSAYRRVIGYSLRHQNSRGKSERWDDGNISSLNERMPSVPMQMEL